MELVTDIESGTTTGGRAVGRDETLAGRLISMEVDGMTFDGPRRLWDVWEAHREVQHAD